MDRHAGIKPECAMTGRKNPPYSKPINTNNRQGRGKCMSESINGNEANRIVDRKGEGRSNRWQRKTKLTGKMSRDRSILKERQQGIQQRKKYIETQRGTRGEEVVRSNRERLH